MLELHTADLNTLRHFYGEVLGLPTEMDDAGGFITVTAGASVLRYRASPGFSGVYHYAFNIPENRLNAAKQFLETRGVTLLADSSGEAVFDFDFWNAHTIYFYDPAGNIAEFIARHELPNAAIKTDLPFSPDEILNVCEIALPTDDVPTLVAEMQDATGTPVYGDPSPTFTALGDANGLLILVPKGRIWFPDTGIPAESLAVHVVAYDNDGKRFVVDRERDAGQGYGISL